MADTELDVWQSVEQADDGFSVTTYSQAADGELVVEDESWWTWDELALMLPSSVVGDTVYVLEESPNGTPQSLSPVGVFTDFDEMDDFVDEHRPESWRWSEHTVDEYVDEDEESD